MQFTIKQIAVRVLEGLALCTVVAWWGADGSDRELGDGQRAASTTFTVGEHYCRLFVFKFRWWLNGISNHIVSTSEHSVYFGFIIFIYIRKY